jgi:hypothetical protein
MLVLLSIQPVNARNASVQERTGMSQSVADYIEDVKVGDMKADGALKGVRAVEIAAAAIEWPWALADWRSADGTAHGQILFRYMCDHWNVRKVSREAFAQNQHLTALGVPEPSAIKLISEIAAAETHHVAYLMPSRAGVGC